MGFARSAEQEATTLGGFCTWLRGMTGLRWPSRSRTKLGACVAEGSCVVGRQRQNSPVSRILLQSASMSCSHAEPRRIIHLLGAPPGSDARHPGRQLVAAFHGTSDTLCSPVCAMRQVWLPGWALAPMWHAVLAADLETCVAGEQRRGEGGDLGGHGAAGLCAQQRDELLRLRPAEALGDARHLHPRRVPQPLPRILLRQAAVQALSRLLKVLQLLR